MKRHLHRPLAAVLGVVAVSLVGVGLAHPSGAQADPTLGQECTFNHVIGGGFQDCAGSSAINPVTSDNLLVALQNVDDTYVWVTTSNWFHSWKIDANDTEWVCLDPGDISIDNGEPSTQQIGIKVLSTPTPESSWSTCKDDADSANGD